MMPTLLMIMLVWLPCTSALCQQVFALRAGLPPRLSVDHMPIVPKAILRNPKVVRIEREDGGGTPVTGCRRRVPTGGMCHRRFFDVGHVSESAVAMSPPSVAGRAGDLVEATGASGVAGRICAMEGLP
jgi:hypothetical protein